MNVQERARKDVKNIMANKDRSGTPYTVISPGGTEYHVIGMIGDIGLLIAPETGEKVQSRSIAATALIGDFAGACPGRGWKVRIMDRGTLMNMFVSSCAPDRTLGVYNFTLSVDAGAQDD